MLRRCIGLAILGIFAITVAPAFGQTSTYNKDAVQALSKRIDQHLANTWKNAGVTPAPKADDYVFFRRLNLDLLGRIPDLTDITDFIDNQDADKRWMWVDRLLDGTAHSRHFANVWRNTMMGYQTNQQAQFLTPSFELWLRERIEKNVPLDQTVLQLLTSQQNPNMAFNQGMPQSGSPQLFYVANENKAENLAAATSRVFLGVKIECAQCHAHPFAKWSKDQFWEFAAFYSAVQPKIPVPKLAKDTGKPLPNYTPGREILIPGTEKVVKARFLNGQEPNWEGSASPRKTLADWVVSRDNPYFARAMADHIWSYLMGVDLLTPIMEPSDDSPLTHVALLDDLAKALIDNNFDAKFLMRAIVHTDAYQRSSGGAKLADKEDYQLFVRMPIRALSPEQIFDSVVIAVTNPTSEERTRLLTPAFQPQFFNPNQMGNNPRQQFMLKFTTQDRRYEPQTSILQALFMMNGGFLADKTKPKNNEDLKSIGNPDTNYRDGYAGRLDSLYRMVLSRPARADEKARLIPYLERGGATGDLSEAVSDIYWALLNSSEFLLNH